MVGMMSLRYIVFATKSVDKRRQALVSLAELCWVLVWVAASGVAGAKLGSC